MNKENIVKILGLDKPGKKENVVLNLTHTDLDGAVSDKVIPSGHSVQESPEAILEIRRIMHEHLAGK